MRKVPGWRTTSSNRVRAKSAAARGPAALAGSLRGRGRPALLAAALALLGSAAHAETDAEIGASAGAYAVLTGGLGEWQYDCGLSSGCRSASGTAFKLGAGWRWRVFAVEVWALDYGSTTTAAGTRLHPRAFGLGAAWQWPASPQVDTVVRTGLVQVDRVRSSTSDGAGHVAFGLALVGRMTSSLSYEVAWDSTSSALLDRFANTFTFGVRAAF